MGKVEKTKREAVKLTQKWSADMNVGRWETLWPCHEERWGEIIRKVKEVKGLLDRLEIWEAVETTFWKNHEAGATCFAPPCVHHFLSSEEDVKEIYSWWSGLRGWKCVHSGAKFTCLARACDNRAPGEFVSEETYQRFPQICRELFLSVKEK